MCGGFSFTLFLIIQSYYTGYLNNRSLCSDKSKTKFLYWSRLSESIVISKDTKLYRIMALIKRTKRRSYLKERWKTDENYNRWAKAINRQSQSEYEFENEALAEIYRLATESGGTVSNYESDNMIVHFTDGERPRKDYNSTQGEMLAHLGELEPVDDEVELPDKAKSFVDFILGKSYYFSVAADDEGGTAVLIPVYDM